MFLPVETMEVEKTEIPNLIFKFSLARSGQSIKKTSAVQKGDTFNMKRKLLSLLGVIALLLSFGASPNAQAQSCDLFPSSTCYTVQFGADSYFDVVLDFNPGTNQYALMPATTYQGWCMFSFAPITPGSPYCGAIQRRMSDGVPAYLTVHQDVINYLLNNKGSLSRDDVQSIIWNLIEGLGVSPALQPVVNQLLIDGAGFVPGVGQVFGVILDLGPTSGAQPVLVEAFCQPPPPPPGQDEFCFTAAEKTTCYGTVDSSFILDFGTGSRYLTTLPLRLVPVTDTTAMLTGVVYKAGSPSSKFNVALTLSGYSDPGAQPGWVSYSSMVGTLTGLEGFAGMNLMVSSTSSVQIGLGANGINPEFGISGKFNWIYTTSSGGGKGTLAGLATDCVDITEECLVESKGNGSSHAIYLPGIGTDFIAGNNPLRFVESTDGSGSITGVVYSASNPSKSFAVNFSVDGMTSVAPAGSPKKELPSSAYIENGGPINPATWVYYPIFNGTLTGLGSYSGAVITINRVGPAFQVGVGASGKTLNDGASGWFSVTVTKQPSNYYYKLCPTSHGDINVDFGPCVTTPPPCVGTGTIGYWKNHSEAWPVESITIGGKTYTKAQAISKMQQAVAGDKTVSMFSQLVAAKLNVLLGNVSSCIADTITAADAWLVKYPFGSCVSGSSYAWYVGEPLHNKLDDYNNGRLCAPHRDSLNCGGSTPPPPTCEPKPTCAPNPWKDRNIGSCNYSGSSKYYNGCYTVKGSGSDIWGNKDDCKYVFQNAYGDCEITAKICSIDYTDAWAKCGVMIRESMNSDSKHAFACVTAGNGMAFQRRCNTGGSSDHTSGGSGYSWVKLKRSGNTFTCYKSKDGYSWTKVGESYIKMGSSCYIGLATTSHNNSKTCEAKVTNVKIRD